MSTGAPPAGVPRYVDEVGRRLRDLPRDERESIETDLAQHIRESGCATYRECTDRLGPPEVYAAGLREGLGLAPYRRSRAPFVKVALVVLLSVVAIGVWRVSRPDPLPDDFAPLGVGGYAVSGSDVRSVGGMLIGLGPDAGAARIALFVVNDSDRTLHVERIGLPSVRVRGGETTIGGDPDEQPPLRPGETEVSTIWSTDVRIGPIPDVHNTVLTEHADVDRPFAPFEWAPGTAYVISIDGAVAACSTELAALDGAGGPITVAFSVGDHGFEYEISRYSFDTRAC